MGKENECAVGKKVCNRTILYSCGGCPIAVEACTNALSKIVDKKTKLGGMKNSKTFSRQTLILFDNKNNRIASATVDRGILSTSN